MERESKLNIKVEHHSFINYTFIQNKLNFIQNIRLENTGEELDNVRILIKSTFNLFEDYSINIDVILQNEVTQLTEFNFKYNLPLLLKPNTLIYSISLKLIASSLVKLHNI